MNERKPFGPSSDSVQFPRNLGQWGGREKERRTRLVSKITSLQSSKCSLEVGVGNREE